MKNYVWCEQYMRHFLVTGNIWNKTCGQMHYFTSIHMIHIIIRWLVGYLKIIICIQNYRPYASYSAWSWLPRCDFVTSVTFNCFCNSAVANDGITIQFNMKYTDNRYFAVRCVKLRAYTKMLVNIAIFRSVWESPPLRQKKSIVLMWTSLVSVWILQRFSTRKK